MSNPKRTTLRNLLIAGLMSLSLVLAPSAAEAEFIDYNVAEGTVPGANDQTILNVDKLNGAYTEFISIDGAGNFTTSAYATFTQYLTTEGTVEIGSQLGSDTDNQYLIYALFNSTGTVTPVTATILEFTGLSATSTLYIDPNSDTTLALVGGVATATGGTADDYEILIANDLLNPGSGGVLIVGAVEAGGFSLKFVDPTLTECDALDPTDTECGEAYWPTLALIQVILANVTGDFDDVFAGIGIPSNGTITGDVSIVFEDISAVPEPATLTLLGLGLAGSALARRRRQSKSKV